MMLSKRFYITLNPSKKKDKLILDFLKSHYSESETIKSILYLYAIQGSNKVQLDAKGIEKVNDKVHLLNDISIKKVQKGDESNKVDLDIDDDIMNMFK
ncbi:hypothetical protein [Clostridium tertium]|uniref:hypothetical protein n=1 Tax=Clostridium tertium TaxID=1559 RepID=UPI000BE3B8CB|nr:hypothetical protein [Clostridium tertium]